ncbi:hypothetical protein Tco_0827171 [Tanacetum coccineum]
MDWRKEIRDCCKEAREAKIVLREIANRRALFIEELDSLGVHHVPAKFTEFLKEIQAKDRETLANLQILMINLVYLAMAFLNLTYFVTVHMDVQCRQWAIWLWVADKEVE